MPIGTARAARRGRLPVAIPDSDNLQTHFDILDKNNYGDGESIDSLTDRVGSLDATEGEGATYRADALNDKPVAEFDTDDDYLQIPDSTDEFNYLHDGSGGTFYLVLADPQLDGDNGGLFDSSGGIDNSVGWFIRDHTSGGLSPAVGDGDDPVFSTQIDDFDSNVIGFTHAEDEGPQWVVFDENGVVADGDYDNDPSSSDATNDLTINARPDGSRSVGYAFAEWLSYSAYHDDDSRSDVIDYLSRWGI